MPARIIHGEALWRSNAKATDWLFPNPKTGKPYWPSVIHQYRLAPAAIKAGIGKMGWHAFRHSYSTLLRAEGVDVKVQQGLLRHADVSTTLNIYTQAIPEAVREGNSKVVKKLLAPTETA